MQENYSILFFTKSNRNYRVFDCKADSEESAKAALIKKFKFDQVFIVTVKKA
jgi:hypothetical protein